MKAGALAGLYADCANNGCLASGLVARILAGERAEASGDVLDLGGVCGVAVVLGREALLVGVVAGIDPHLLDVGLVEVGAGNRRDDRRRSRISQRSSRI